jgi:ATP-dependent protease ClpP protease subunit
MLSVPTRLTTIVCVNSFIKLSDFSGLDHFSGLLIVTHRPLPAVSACYFCNMEWKYTIDPNADEPVMLLNKHIGCDEKDGEGIAGDDFQRELLLLDAMEKKRIWVWVNSIGGSVTAAWNIYSAMVNARTPVDTYCVGIAASAAAWIFEAGRYRIMADYAMLLCHNPYAEKGADEALLQKMRGSIATMLAARTGKPLAMVHTLMDNAACMSASEALVCGLCDAIEASAPHDRKQMQRLGAIKDKWRAANSILNKTLEHKHDHMTVETIADRLQLATADGQGILDAIDALENRATRLQHDLDSAMREKYEARRELQQLRDTLTRERTLLEAQNMIKQFAIVGKIKNDPATIQLWTDKALTDLEGVKNMLQSLPVNAKAPDMPIENRYTPGELPTTAPSLSARIIHRLKTR